MNIFQNNVLKIMYSGHADNEKDPDTFNQIKTPIINYISNGIQTMFSDLMMVKLCPETLSELRSLCGFDLIEGDR